MSTDWFARKLGGAPRPPAPVQPVAQPVQQPVAQPQVPVNPNSPPQPGQPGTLTHALQNPNTQTRGGLAARTEGETCPGCGSGNYFSRRNSGVEPKKHCYDCGYPLIQYGSDQGEGGAIQMTRIG